MLITIELPARRALSIAMLASLIWLSGCGHKAPPVIVNATLKRDGSHLSGTVLRKESNSITIMGAGGYTHTFLYNELTDIKYDEPNTPLDSQSHGPEVTRTPANSGVELPVRAEMQFAEGTLFPVRSNGFLDSCCVTDKAISLGTLDANVKDSKGNVAIPQGANVVMELLEKKVVDHQISMVFQLITTDFNGHHYVISSAPEGSATGLRVTVSGAKENSPEAKIRGTSIHVDDQSLMEFKAVSPIVVKLSQ